MAEKLQCVVIDDEPIGREIIEEFVRQVSFLHVAGSFGDPVEALTYLHDHKVDIVFSDIEMPRLNGMQLVKALNNHPAIIFITAHRDFALDGFEYGAVDYLVKPVRFDRFLQAVNRVKRNIATHTSADKPQQDIIFIKSEGKLIKILLRNILYVEAQDDYLKIETTAGSHSTLATLKSMEEVLLRPDFFRVQRSFIVRLSAVKALNGNMLELCNGKSIAFAPARKEELYTLLGII